MKSLNDIIDYLENKNILREYILSFIDREIQIWAPLGREIGFNRINIDCSTLTHIKWNKKKLRVLESLSRHNLLSNVNALEPYIIGYIMKGYIKIELNRDGNYYLTTRRSYEM